MSELRDRLRRLTKKSGAPTAAEHSSGSHSAPDESAPNASELNESELNGPAQNVSELNESAPNGLAPNASGLNVSVTNMPDDEAESNEAAEWARIGAVICSAGEEGGSFIIRRRRYSLDYCHGRYPLGELLKADHSLALLGSADSELSRPEHLLFFDTETTGLGVGAGNVPFMIGYGHLDGGQFVVEQLFIRNLSEEYDALIYLKDKLDRFSHVVTYNGRTFDWPVLKNRYVIHRIPPPQEAAHIDFLYPSRSLWKRTLPSCKLSTVENRILGYERGHDLPGSEAPLKYMQYLDTSRVEDVTDVFIHNERDILSLAVLAVHFHGMLNGAVPPPCQGGVREDGVRLSWWLDRLGRRTLAREVLKHTLYAGAVDRQQLLEAAALCKKWRNYDTAAALWRKYCEKSTGTIHALEPLIELAIYYEHRKRDIETALAWSHKARSMIERRISFHRGQPSDRELLRQIDRRLERLQRKIGKPRQEMIRFQ